MIDKDAADLLVDPDNFLYSSGVRRRLREPDPTGQPVCKNVNALLTASYAIKQIIRRAVDGLLWYASELSCADSSASPGSPGSRPMHATLNEKMRLKIDNFTSMNEASPGIASTSSAQYDHYVAFYCSDLMECIGNCAFLLQEVFREHLIQVCAVFSLSSMSCLPIWL